MRIDGRHLDQVREINIRYGVVQGALASCLVESGNSRIQLAAYSAEHCQFENYGPLSIPTQLSYLTLQNYLSTKQVNYQFEQWILNDDGSLGSLLWQAYAILLSQLKSQELANVVAINVSVNAEDLLLADPNKEEEKAAQANLMHVKEIDGPVLASQFLGQCSSTLLQEATILAERIINQSVVEQASAQPTKEIMIATKNQGKAAEFKALFQPFGYQVKTMLDYPDLPEVIEDGTTFAQNAMKKAETLANHLQIPVLGDDSGLCVDALGGMPGVYSARYAADHNDAANNAKLLSELAGVPFYERTAHFHTTLAFAAPNKETLIVDGEVEGIIAEVPRGDNGFGYDPLFYLPELDRTMAELTLEQKNQLSHRANAIANLVPIWQEWLEA